MLFSSGRIFLQILNLELFCSNASGYHMIYSYRMFKASEVLMKIVRGNKCSKFRNKNYYKGMFVLN
jgi:hypothetical protein